MKSNWISLLLMLLLTTQSVLAVADVHQFHHGTAMDTAEHHHYPLDHQHDSSSEDLGDQGEHHHHNHCHSQTQFVAQSTSFYFSSCNPVLNAVYNASAFSPPCSNLFRPPRV